MQRATNVSTDDLVNSLLQSVTTPASHNEDTTTSSTAGPLESPPPFPVLSSSSSSAAAAAASPERDTPLSPAPSSVTNAPSSPPTNRITPAPLNPATAPDATRDTGPGATKTDHEGGVILSIIITLGVLGVVIAALFFLRSRRKRNHKTRQSDASPPAGTSSVAVPAHRGFKKERELGIPEMSIELSPGDLGLSKGFDVSYASSTRTSTASNQFDISNASSTDSSVFNTRGGLSPTFSSRKMTSYSYHYRESEENSKANPHLASNTMFHLTGLIGNGQASGRGGNSNPSRGPGSRKLSAPDEYAELVTATNAHDQMDVDIHNQSTLVHADFTQSATSQNEMDISMGPDDNHSFLAPLPTRVVLAPTRARPARASEESMGPDSPVTGSKRTGPVYNTIPNLSGEKMSALLRNSEDDSQTMSAASFLTASSISSTSTRDSVATTAGESVYVSAIPLLQQLSSAGGSDYDDDNTSNRASAESLDSTNTARPGSLIALNLEAKGGTSEIAI